MNANTSNTPVSTRVLTRIYNFQGHNVRAVITRANETLFCLNDVCECCEIQKRRHASAAIRERFGAQQKALESAPTKVVRFTDPLCDEACGNTTALLEPLDLKEQQSEQGLSLSAQLDELTDDLCYCTDAREHSAFYACDDVEQDTNDPIKTYTVETPGGMQKMLFITEPQLYFVMFRGRSDMAKAFSMWVCNEVLPSIRKHGYYHTSYHNLTALPALPMRNALGHYDVSYPQVLRQVQEYYQMDCHSLELLQWVVERAIAQGYARAKTNERELTEQVNDLKEQLKKVSSETLGLSKAEREEWEDKYNETWQILDDAQSELALVKKHNALYKSAVCSLLDACSNAKTKELVEAAIDCIF